MRTGFSAVLHTRVSINLLKQVYLATHPGASEKRAAEAAEPDFKGISVF